MFALIKFAFHVRRSGLYCKIMHVNCTINKLKGEEVEYCHAQFPLIITQVTPVHDVIHVLIIQSAVYCWSMLVYELCM